ncbi:ferric reductase-like transmembrane domain-containing protein [Estrella lausannensis]|uniref:Ferric reductase domain-containing protein n=1 Tax=Estrella lausannensis TaxID=483423 RepID=A0A0H5DSA5_9BACT|nr:ferredoxin reductase family protein [Estrella lausannensis]CRX38624.1 Ferric reductase domain-containing protein [Estrella lausannensis]
MPCATSAALLAAWIYITIDDWKVGDTLHILKEVGRAIGFVGYVLFSLSLFLSSRIKKLEDWLGGLDQIYYLHHKIGLWGFYFIVCHPWFFAAKWLFGRPDKFFLSIFPVHSRLAVNLGSLAFWLMLLIIGATIFKVLSYDKWKRLHQLMSLAYILATLHILLLQKPFSSSNAALALVCAPMGLGLLGILYRQVLAPFYSSRAIYKVSEAEKINENVVKITFKPEAEPLKFRLGQYAFFSFQDQISKEQHPFTICKESDDRISIFVKARGDFTKSLYRSVHPDLRVCLEGPYGRFDFMKGRENQIWIAGGIGIVPFLAWKEQIRGWPGKIDLFYCVHRMEDAVLLDQFQRIQNDNFRCFLHCTENNKRLTINHLMETETDLPQKDIFMCGPKSLTRPFVAGLMNAGVKRHHIYFEDFDFF